MNKSRFLCSLLLTATLLSMPVLATNLDEEQDSDRQEFPKDYSAQDEQNATRKAQIKATEDIGAFLGSCVPQMRYLTDWIKGPSSEGAQSLIVQSMIQSPQHNHDAVIENFKQNAQTTINQLAQNGLHLTENYSTELYAKKMGDLNAHSILASLLARIYEIELSLEEAFPPYFPHTELSLYYKLHQTFQKEKEGLQKRQKEQELHDFQPEVKLPSETPLAALTRELETKFQKAKKELKRLTVALSEDDIPDFSVPGAEEELNDLPISPRNYSSPQRMPRAESPSSRHGNPHRHDSQEGMISSPTSRKETPEGVVKRGRAMSAMSSSDSSINSSSAPSSPTVSSKARKISRSESIGTQLISPQALKKSPLFTGRTISPAEAASSSDSSEPGDSPKRTKSKIFKGLKNPFKKRSSASESSSSLSSGNTSVSSTPPEK